MQHKSITTIAAIATMLASVSELKAAGKFPLQGGYAQGYAFSMPNKTTGDAKVDIWPQQQGTFYYSSAGKAVGSSTCEVVDSGYLTLSTHFSLVSNWNPAVAKYGSMFTYDPAHNIGAQAWVGTSSSDSNCY